MLNFLGKTAIVTGAGGGLGRQYALELAKRYISKLLTKFNEMTFIETMLYFLCSIPMYRDFNVINGEFFVDSHIMVHSMLETKFLSFNNL
jgi:hypothetical protein